MTHNVSQITEGRAFQHSIFFKERKFDLPLSCPTKHHTPACGNLLLAAVCFCLALLSMSEKYLSPERYCPGECIFVFMFQQYLS
jgi:hypothetical protein